MGISRLAGTLGLLLCVGALQAGTLTFAGYNFTTNGGNGSNPALDGSNLQIIADDLGAGTGAEGSAYISQPYTITQNTPFTATFSFLMSNSDSAENGLGLADGLTFVVQSQGPNALGDAGGSLGYASYTPSLVVTPSVAVALRTFAYNDVEIDQGGNLGGPSQSVSFPGAEYDVQTTGTITVSYDGVNTLTVTGSDSEGDTISLSSAVNFAALGGYGYVGFAGASGSGSANEEITGFTLSGLTPVPEPATFLPVVAGLLGIGGWRRYKTGKVW